MIIERVEVHRFGCLSDLSLTLDEGFTLVTGGNESGKSSLAAFIRYMLYGFPTDGTDEERTRRTPLDGAPVGGSMVFSVREGRFLVERHSTNGADGYRDEVSLTHLDTGKREMPGISPGCRFLGVEAEVYDATAHLDAMSLSVDGAYMGNAIEALIFSDAEAHRREKAVKTLTEVREQLVGTDGEGGAVGALLRRRREREAQLAAVVRLEKELLSKENQLHETRRKHKAAVKELDKFRHLETDYRNVSLIQSYDHLHEAEDALTAREADLAAFIEGHKMGEVRPDASYLAELSEARERLSVATETRDEAIRARDEARAVPEPINEEERNLISAIVDRETGDERIAEVRRIGKRTALNIVALVAFSLLMVGGLALLIASLLDGAVGMIFLAAVMLIISVGGDVTSYLEYRKTGAALTRVLQSCCASAPEQMQRNIEIAVRAKENYEAHLRMLRDADAVLFRAEEAYASAYARMEAAFATFGENMPDGLAAIEALFGELAREAGEYIREVARLGALRDETEAEVRSLRAELYGKSEVAVRALVAPADRARLAHLNAEDLRHGVEHYERLVAELSAKEEALVKELSEKRENEHPAHIAESIMTLDTRIADLRARAEHCRLATEAILAGEGHLHEEILPRLSEYASRMLDRLTDGKYTELCIGEGLSLALTTAEGDLTEERFGNSARILALLALRLSLVDLLYSELPPLVLDECTAMQDDEHAAAFFRTLRLLTHEGRQCVCFTCHEREERLACEVFTAPHCVRL